MKAPKRLFNAPSLVPGLISVVTKLETFPNMAISSLTFTNDTDTGGKLSFNAELIQVVYARVETTLNVSPKNTALARSTSPVSNKGNVDKKEVLDKGKSWSASFTDWVSGADR